MPTKVSSLPLAPPFDAIETMEFIERKTPFDNPAFLSELKYDGYRMLANVDGSAIQLKTRRGTDATKWFPELTASLADLGGGRHVLDGEVTVLDSFGRADFERLQARAKLRRYKPGADVVVYCVFDLLVHAGKDVRQQPLSKRKQALGKLLRKKMPSILLVQSVESGTWLYEQACALKIEGIVSKRLDSVYLSGTRTNDWIKVKRPGAIPPQRFKRGNTDLDSDALSVLQDG